MAVYQGEYYLLQRSIEKRELLLYTAEQNISFSSPASGLLAGKYNKDMKFKDLLANMSRLLIALGRELIMESEWVEKVEQKKKYKQRSIKMIKLVFMY